MMSRPENVKWVDVSLNKLSPEPFNPNANLQSQLKLTLSLGPPRPGLRSRYRYSYYPRVLSRSYETSLRARSPAQTLAISLSTSCDTRPNWSGHLRVGDRLRLRAQTDPPTTIRKSRCFIQWTREECLSSNTATYTANRHSNNSFMVLLSIWGLPGS
jgi:hypothetical protein